MPESQPKPHTTRLPAFLLPISLSNPPPFFRPLVLRLFFWPLRLLACFSGIPIFDGRLVRLASRIAASIAGLSPLSFSSSIVIFRRFSLLESPDS